MTSHLPIPDTALEATRDGLEGVTPGPYQPCTHLRSKEGDDACPCGYRGGAWSATTDEIVFEMGGTPEHDGNKMLPEPDRDTRRLNAQHLARLDPGTVRALLARLDAAEMLMLDLRAYIVMHDDISMHSKAVALSDRVNNHFPSVGSGSQLADANSKKEPTL